MSRRVVLVCLKSPQLFWNFTDRHLRTLRSAFPAVDFRTTSTEAAVRELPYAHVYFGWRFLPEWFIQAPRLEWIASPAAGTDHLPVAQASVSGIAVTRGYGYHARPMTEHALGLILAFSRGLLTSSRLQRTRRWWKDDLAAEFFDLAGATLAIVGCGAIGWHLAQTANFLGMQTIGVRRSVPSATDASDGITWMRSEDAASAVAAADVVVNLLPATASTQYFFDRDLLAACKPGALFVNIGRGATVDHDALLDALDSGHLGGAALDVTEPRPLPREHRLRHHPRVALTPKTAAFSHRYMDEAVSFFADNVHRHLHGWPLNGAVTVPAPTRGGHLT